MPRFKFAHVAEFEDCKEAKGVSASSSRTAKACAGQARTCSTQPIAQPTIGDSLELHRMRLRTKAGFARQIRKSAAPMHVRATQRTLQGMQGVCAFTMQLLEIYTRCRYSTDSRMGCFIIKATEAAALDNSLDIKHELCCRDSTPCRCG